MVEEILFSKYYKEIATPILRKSLEEGLKLIDKLKSNFLIEGQEITFLCPENREKWSVVFRSKKGFIGGKEEFHFPSIRKVAVSSIIPLKDITSQCIITHPNRGFELVYKNLNEDVPYLLEIEFDIEDPRLINNLVYKNVQKDTVQDYRRYWMQAQLKFVDVLDKAFSNVRFEDLDFDVRVSTHEDIRTSIPASFKRELEVVVKWMSETDRERKRRLSREHLRLLRARRGGRVKHKRSILEILQELQDIFLPRTFRTFLQVRQDFYYHDCFRGVDYYSAPFPTWPKFMTIITRTHLNLDKPAANGYLDFDYQKFKKKIEDIFSSFL